MSSLLPSCGIAALHTTQCVLWSGVLHLPPGDLTRYNTTINTRYVVSLTLEVKKSVKNEICFYWKLYFLCSVHRFFLQKFWFNVSHSPKQRYHQWSRFSCCVLKHHQRSALVSFLSSSMSRGSGRGRWAGKGRTLREGNKTLVSTNKKITSLLVL